MGVDRGMSQGSLNIYILCSWCSSDAILSEAYASAVTLFKQKLTKSERKIIWVESKTGIEDIQAALQEAKRKYDDRKGQQASVRTWLSMFSSRLMYYGGILDMVRNNSGSLSW
jgi:hypothetical protein